MVRVLVVEDEANIREMIALNLRLAGMEAVEAESAEAALPLLEKKPGCDAAILDVMLPGMNGFSLCETIRRTDQKIGIIILSAKGQEQDKIRGLSIGADDYMTKPFSVSELLARVKALCRRVGRTAGGDEKEKEKENGVWSIDFDVELRYQRPNVIRCSYPPIIHGEFLPEMWFNKNKTFMFRKHTATSSLATMAMERFKWDLAHASPGRGGLGIKEPYFDDWGKEE
jgi:CheY-like chemotaxis protein